MQFVTFTGDISSTVIVSAIQVIVTTDFTGKLRSIFACKNHSMQVYWVVEITHLTPRL